VVTREIAAEAAVWVARLHGPDRSSEMERECLAWQDRSEENRLAFERCTEIWQEVPGVSLGDAFAAAGASPDSRTSGTKVWFASKRWALALSLTGALALGTAILQQWRGATSYGTGVGEQRLVVLDDGTRLTLNTATRVQVNLRAHSRSVSVEDGEALFEVAKDPSRPFVVRVGGSEVRALGTVFSVRFTPRQAGASDVAVTLIEGQVSVHPETYPDGTKSSQSGQLILHPGERARLAAAAASGRQAAKSPLVDHPPVDQLVAWKRGDAVFDDVPLEQAVAEMNRYSRTPIVLVVGATATSYRISGVFRTGDNAGFAKAVAALHGLVVRELPERLELAQRS
jgi:transmembrane sensor